VDHLRPHELPIARQPSTEWPPPLLERSLSAGHCLGESDLDGASHVDHDAVACSTQGQTKVPGASAHLVEGGATGSPRTPGAGAVFRRERGGGAEPGPGRRAAASSGRRELFLRRMDRDR
jgi:hypothetical protein